MKRMDAVFKLNRLLDTKYRRPMPLARICEELECSPATAKRCIQDLRERFNHPVVYDREAGGYRYASEAEGNDGWQLPGLWFNASELHALLSMRQMLERVEPGVFERELAPLGRRIESLLESTGKSHSEVIERIRVIAIATRRLPDNVFRVCADAVLQRRRLSLCYQARGGNAERSTRTVSPQRLVHYRDNWYLDAYCHLRNGLRTFALDQMSAIRALDAAADDVDDKAMDEFFSASYGIFAGAGDNEALLRFTPERARWVAKESWHPAQKGRELEDGSWELRLPYSKPDELMMDVLKYGPDVEVLAPPALREQVAARLAEAARRYGRMGERNNDR